MRIALCAMVIAGLAAACSSASSKPQAAGTPTGSPSQSPSPSVTATPSPSAPATPATPSVTDAGGVSPPIITGSIPPASIHGKRVAEVSAAGGQSAFGSLGYQPPELAVYADGSVVLDADMWFHLAPADLAALLSGLQKDLAGQPAVLTATSGQAMPDVGDTVLGVRRADGGYQTVRANALARRTSAYPAPVVAAYQALEAVKTSSAAKARTPYIGDAVRLAYECPVSTTAATQFWPDGLPAPTHPKGQGCPETLTVSQGNVAVARDACLIYDTALQPGGTAQEVPYLAEGGAGIRTCVWRWALPDENSR